MLQIQQQQQQQHKEDKINFKIQCIKNNQISYH